MSRLTYMTSLYVTIELPFAYSFFISSSTILSISFCSRDERSPIARVRSFSKIVTITSYEKSFAKALIAVLFSVKLFSTSCLVSFTAVSAGSSGEISFVSIYASCGSSIFIPTDGIFTVANFILSGSVSTAAELS